MTVTRQVLVPMSEAHYEWVRTYAKAQGMSVEAVVRLAIRVHNLVELTPGASDALAALQPTLGAAAAGGRRMKPDYRLTPKDILDGMHMQLTVRVPRSTVWVVTVRLWLACRLAVLAGLVAGCSIDFEATDAVDGEGEGG